MTDQLAWGLSAAPLPEPSQREQRQRASIVELRGVTRSFARSGRCVSALRDITATIGPGRITGVIGLGGAGKTTLLRLIAGLSLPDSGSVHVNGRDVRLHREEVNKAVGYMPQRFGLYDDLTVHENLTLYARLSGVAKTEERNRVKQIIELVGLLEFSGSLAIHLSGGMRQKLALGSVLLCERRLILLDEPTVGVDPLSRQELWEIIRLLPDRNQTSVVIATSQLTEAANCDDVVLLDEGCVLAHDSPDMLATLLRARVYDLPASGAARGILQRQLANRPEVLHVMVNSEGLRFLVAEGAAVPALETVAATSSPMPVHPSCEDALLAIIRASRKISPSPALSTVMPPAKALPVSIVSIVQLKNVSHWFGSFCALKNVSFDVRQGEIFGLLGANGAGKSTIMKLLCGLLRPTEGAVSVADMKFPVATAAGRARIGYVAQRFALYAKLTVHQNLRLFAAAYGLPRQREDERLAWAIAYFGLKTVMHAETNTLPRSFGQRLALACSLLHEPDILFLDEPTSGIDAIARQEFWEWIRALAEQGVTILVSTHFMEEAEQCDRLAVLDGGELIAIGTPREIKSAAAEGVGRPPTMEAAFVKALRSRRSPKPKEAVPSASALVKSRFESQDSRCRRIYGLALKERHQIMRDSSSLVLAFVMPLVLLILFGFGVSLDAKMVPIALVLEQTDQLSQSLTGAFRQSKYFKLSVLSDMRQATQALDRHEVLGIVRVRSTSNRDLLNREPAYVQLILNGVDANTARLAESYVHGALSQWNVNWIEEKQNRTLPPILIQPQIWFNRNARSSDYLIPGLIALIMTLTGTLLIAVSTARDWERGTLDALMTTQTCPADLVLGKLTPYYLLSMMSMGIAVTAAVFLFDVPLRGSVGLLIIVASLFLCGSLAFGIVIANCARNQFVASMIAIVGSFMPAFLLSGFIFDIHSMPTALRALTYAIPARYFVNALQTLFLVGNSRLAITFDVIALSVIAAISMLMAMRSTKKWLD